MANLGSIDRPKQNKRTVAIDFDGVIHRYSKGWQNGEIYDVPMPGASAFLEYLKEKYRVVVFTARDRSKVEHWMGRWQLSCDEVTNIKPPAIAYIDDRGVNFDGDWGACAVRIEELENKK